MEFDSFASAGLLVMDPILGTLLASWGMAVSARVFDKARYKRIEGEWKALEFVKFRGQHYKYLRKRNIAELIVESAKKSAWQINFILNEVRENHRDWALAAVVRVKNGNRFSKIFLRCKIESYGKFFQILYEWNGEENALKVASSPECLALQDFVYRTERLVGEAELRKSRLEYKLGGAMVLDSAPFTQSIVRHVLINAIAGKDDYGKTIPFKVSLEAKPNQWNEVVEAYVAVDQSSGFQIRFYALPLNNSKAWELHCDWKGSLDAMLEPLATEWKIVHSLFAEVVAQFEKSGAKRIFPTKEYENIIDLGILQTWDSEVLEKLARRVAREYTGTIELEDGYVFKTYLTGMQREDPRVPGAYELGFDCWRGTTMHSEIQIGMHNRTYKLPWRNVRAEACIQFQPLPPKCGHLILAWSAKADEFAKSKALAPREIIRLLESRMQKLLHRVGAHPVDSPYFLQIEFLKESIDEETAMKVRGFWPTAQDYNEAVQSPEICFDDPDLKSGIVSVNTLGIPRAASGAFASVYKLSSQSSEWALRCFNEPVKDQLLRYEKTSSFVCNDDLPYTVACEFIEHGIKVATKWYPVVKMEWVDGTPINTYIANVLNDKEAISSLRLKFVEMMQAFVSHGIAHGDLQHGNIIMKNGEFVLVDYDNMYVPELKGFMSWETGHRNYQHPKRNSNHFGPYLDHFSAWVIDTALLCLEKEPALWERFGAGDENLLFSAIDFLNPDDSELFQLLIGHKDTDLCQRGMFLQSLLQMEVPKIPPLSF